MYEVCSTTTAWLAHAVSKTNNGLIDEVTQFEYHLNPTAHRVVSLLIEGNTIARTAEILADETKIPRAEAHHDIEQLVEELNQLTLMNTGDERKFLHRMRDVLLMPQLYLFNLAQRMTNLGDLNIRAARLSPTLASLLSAMKVVTLVAAVVSASAVIFMSLAIAPQRVPQSRQAEVALATLSPIWLAMIVVLSIILHELGHLMVLRHLLGRELLRTATGIVARGPNISVIHAVSEASHKRLIALIGPALACITCALIALVSILLKLPWMYSAGAIALGLSHLYALTPWNSDGKMLWKA